jgi:hypothetical protein
VPSGNVALQIFHPEDTKFVIIHIEFRFLRSNFSLSNLKRISLSRATQQRRFTFLNVSPTTINISQEFVFIYPHKIFVKLALMVYRRHFKLYEVTRKTRVKTFCKKENETFILQCNSYISRAITSHVALHKY